MSSTPPGVPGAEGWRRAGLRADWTRRSGRPQRRGGSSPMVGGVVDSAAYSRLGISRPSLRPGLERCDHPAPKRRAAHVCCHDVCATPSRARQPDKRAATRGRTGRLRGPGHVGAGEGSSLSLPLVRTRARSANALPRAPRNVSLLRQKLSKAEPCVFVCMDLVRGGQAKCWNGAARGRHGRDPSGPHPLSRARTPPQGTSRAFTSRGLGGGCPVATGGCPGGACALETSRAAFAAAPC